MPVLALNPWTESKKPVSGFDKKLNQVNFLVSQKLDTFLAVPDGPESWLFDAMRYTTLSGGKGFRPLLCHAAASLFNVPETRSVQAAAAIEVMHCYSLIHDDLPSMDDDKLRRGKATLHLAYDEATAILAGDALQSLAFELLSDEETHENPRIRIDLVAGLARAAGMHGMVGGQTIDMLSPSLKLDAGGLTRLQKMKTGALIAFAVDAGALLGEATRPQRHALAGYAHDVGLAFQIADDVLDVQGASDVLGKTAGKDAAQEKVTFASLLGVSRARDQASLLVEQAVGHLDIFGQEADTLRQAAEFVIGRDS